MASVGFVLSSRVLPADAVRFTATSSAALGGRHIYSARGWPPRSWRVVLRTVRAVQNDGSQGGPRRLVDIVRLVPEISRNYFKSPSRRALFGTISLSFGALGVNDVIAAVVCVLVTEYVTRFYYSRPKVTFPLALLNNFKMGFTYGLFIDAFKLAS
ncbi:unnamed protein product [Spirodela intermedia]|uniref:Uncharacterized protein n=1 Tax=Spirodela intermedia TaxID=51605 RepID=A0A7I8IQQ9_SPIIN|nr:unnamed protein product [Spirodela intermedia]CAA6660122.1 unnamed protein product [Spirodela intermedia]